MAYNYVQERLENHRPQSGLSLQEMNKFIRDIKPLLQNAIYRDIPEAFFNIPASIAAYAEKNKVSEEKARAAFLKNPQTYIAHHNVQYFGKVSVSRVSTVKPSGP